MQSMTRTTCAFARRSILAALAAAATLSNGAAQASDHLDTPTVIADPRADIGDLYAWTSYDGKHLNLVMTIVGHTFSDQLEYVFHIDSGKALAKTTATTDIVCRMPAENTVDCRLSGKKDKRLRVFAGLRDDPFFNNVRGTREAYNIAIAFMKSGTPLDAAGCPKFDAATSRAILDTWKHTSGGPATNFLKGWTPASLVISVDLPAVNKGGSMLGVWAATVKDGKQIDRAGRPLTGNALLGFLASADVTNQLKEDYNHATPSTSERFIPEIEKTLAIYDGFDGKCGNSYLADSTAQSPARYGSLATLLADDRLWIDSDSTLCPLFFSVELGDKVFCGGRTLTDDSIDVYRSVLVTGEERGVDDGVDRDERDHSNTDFPFLAAP